MGQIASKSGFNIEGKHPWDWIIFWQKMQGVPLFILVSFGDGKCQIRREISAALMTHDHVQSYVSQFAFDQIWNVLDIDTYYSVLYQLSLKLMLSLLT